MEGWISLHRKLQDNWMWKEKREFSKAEAWIDILLLVNHKDGETVVKNKVYKVKRGDSLVSVKTWANRWGWTRGRAKRFLDLLQEQGMIRFKSDSKTTHLTVCNYDSYQTKQTSNEHQIDIKQTSNEHQIDTDNNDNNDNNEKKNFKEFDFSEVEKACLAENHQKHLAATLKQKVESNGYRFDMFPDVYGRIRVQFNNFVQVAKAKNISFEDVNHIKNFFDVFLAKYWTINDYQAIIRMMNREYKKKIKK